ncbi:hypothetical protein ACHHYP_05070 [Achlya hypogyna]|uniref:GPI transamidase component n=1 Tax=Achlya hypogyna TaxID=1202772 RepID=A0A1V9YZ00_ACHHY|nr:hypothetical protein ACHHYP_05070 [Achlya hypogyna]
MLRPLLAAGFVLGLHSPSVFAHASANGLMLWPSSFDGTLDVSDAHVVTPSARTLAVLDGALEIDTHKRNIMAWYPQIASIDVAFVSAGGALNAVWTELVAQEQIMPVDSEGIHVRVNVNTEAPVASSLEVQGNATALFQQLFGASLGAATYLFANASCDVPAFTATRDAAIPFCFVASRDVHGLAGLAPPSFFGPSTSQLQDAVSSRFPRTLATSDASWSLRYTHLAFAPLQGNKAPLRVIQLALRQVAETADPVALTTSADLPVAVVESIASSGIVHFVELETMDRNSYQSRRVPQSVTDVRSHITGDGFHQMMHVEMALKTPVADVCSLLVVQPFPTTAYADMDELRRLERFGAFDLVSFSKHIEIERPAALSSEHVVAFVKSLPVGATGHVSVEYPVHFRYQSPAKNDLYRPAYVLAPSLFVQCAPASATGPTAWTRVVSHASQPALRVVIPVGDLRDGPIVTAVTLIVSIVGCLVFYKSFPSSTISATSSRRKHT